MDQREIIPLLFRERAEKRMWEGSGRHFLKCGDFGTKLVERGGLVMTGPGKPPLGNLDARLHSSVAQDSLQHQRAQEFADDPGCPMICAAKGRPETFSDMVQGL
jgi:hypothetical protein